MLHATEQRRVEAAYYCQHLEVDKRRLEMDVCNWAAAYNALAVAFSQCSTEHKRFAGGTLDRESTLITPHDALPAQMQECPCDIGSEDCTLNASSIND